MDKQENLYVTSFASPLKELDLVIDLTGIRRVQFVV